MIEIAKENDDDDNDIYKYIKQDNMHVRLTN